MKEDEYLNTAANKNDNKDANVPYFKSRKHKIDIQRESSKKTITEKTYKNMIDKFSRTFDTQLKEFMNAIKASHYEPHIANLMMRLDFNDYYE